MRKIILMESGIKLSAFLIFLSLCPAGCSGSRGYLKFEKLEYPVSMSSRIYDQQGRILSGGKDLAIVKKKFFIERTYWGIFYSLIPLTGPGKEIGDDLNEIIRRYRGNALVNVRISSRSCYLNYFIPLSILPFWPGCSVISISGDVAKKRR